MDQKVGGSSPSKRTKAKVCGLRLASFGLTASDLEDGRNETSTGVSLDVFTKTS